MEAEGCNPGSVGKAFKVIYQNAVFPDSATLHPGYACRVRQVLWLVYVLNIQRSLRRQLGDDLLDHANVLGLFFSQLME
jgi:hypothetical protein